MRDYVKEMKYGDEICESLMPWYEKIKNLIHLQYNTDYKDNIVCPYCQTTILPNEYKEEDFLDIHLNDRDEIWYYITMPCCHQHLFVTQAYYSTTKNKNEFYADLRDSLYKEVEYTKGQYYRARHKYKTICDIIYDNDLKI